MKINKKTIAISVVVAAIGVFAAYVYYFTKDPRTTMPINQTPLPTPLNGTVQEKTALSSPETDPNTIASGQLPVMVEVKEPETVSDQDTGIDPVRLAEAELELAKKQIYEDVAFETFPILSIQTHNPVWVLEDETTANEGRKKKRNGPFGTNIQPAENEIWLRIQAKYASEHRDIMAENADLYRSETGTLETVTVTLWVGGRPYARQQYD